MGEPSYTAGYQVNEGPNNTRHAKRNHQSCHELLGKERRRFYRMIFQPRSSQTIGASVLSSQGDEAPPAALSSDGNESAPDTILAECSKYPCGGGKNAASNGPALVFEMLDGCRLWDVGRWWLLGWAFVGVDSLLASRF